MSTVEKAIKKELIEETGWLIINRPESKNAISIEMWRAIPEAVSQLHAQGARAIVITGTDACFAAGADLKELQAIDGYDKASTFWHAISETLDFIHSFEIPTVAMIDGACIGGGCLLAIACDIRVASTASTFGIPVAKLGIVLDDLSVARLTSLVGPAVASQLLFTGEVVSAEEAEEIGLVNRVTEDSALKETINKLTGAIAGNGYASVREAKRSIRRNQLGLEASGLRPQHESVVVASYLTSDFRQRIDRFNKSIDSTAKSARSAGASEE